MKTAFRFRLYPDRKQSKKMSRMIEAACRLWNDALAKSIHDAGWSRLVRFAEYKASRAGKLVVRVPPACSAQECCFRGALDQVPLSARVFDCRGCRKRLDRDFNAAWIVLKRGLAQVGHDMPELKPAEAGPLPVPTTGRASLAGDAGTIRHETGAGSPRPSVAGGCHHLRCPGREWSAFQRPTSGYRKLAEVGRAFCDWQSPS